VYSVPADSSRTQWCLNRLTQISKWCRWQTWQAVKTNRELRCFETLRAASVKLK
jgi:hypothetical protein